MPWCPKCKNEYRAGITVCTDCKVELVEELTLDPKENSEILCEFANEEIAAKFIEYLTYSSISAFYETSAAKTEDGGEINLYQVYVPTEHTKQAKKALQAFSYVEAANQEAQKKEILAKLKEAGYVEESDTEEEETPSLPRSGNSTYMTKKEKSADYRSSGYTFLIFGVIGTIAMILHWAGVFRYFATISAVVMTIMFAGFILIGIDSFRRAKKASLESDEEETFTKNLTEWLDSNITFDDIKVADRDDLQPEINFLNEINELKQIITRQFGTLDPAFLDQFAEDYYNDHFAE